MAADVRQFKYVDNTATGGKNWTGAFDTNVLADSLIVVAYQEYSGTTTDPDSITDNLNVGQYTQDVKSGMNPDSGDIVWIYRKQNTTAGALTVSFSGSDFHYQSACLIEITGAAPASPVDVTDSDEREAGAPASFTLTTTQPNDIIIVVLGTYNSSSSIVAGSGLEIIQSEPATGPGHRFTTLKMEDAGAADGKTITFTYSGGSTQDCAMAAVAYKIPAAATPTPGVGAAAVTGVAGRLDRGVVTRSTIKGQT